MKLSFAGVSKLRHDYHGWLDWGTTAGYPSQHFQKDKDFITFGTVIRKASYRRAWLSKFVRHFAIEDSRR